MQSETSADFADKEGSNDHFVTTYKTKRPHIQSPLNDPLRLEKVALVLLRMQSRTGGGTKEIKKSYKSKLASCKGTTIKRMESEQWNLNILGKRDVLSANLFQEMILLLYLSCKLFGTCYTVCDKKKHNVPYCIYCVPYQKVRLGSMLNVPQLLRTEITVRHTIPYTYL